MPTNALANELRPARSNMLLQALTDPEFYRRDLLPGAVNTARGLVSGALGAPVDLVTTAIRPLGYDVPAADVVGSTDWFGELFGADIESPAFLAGSIGPVPDAGDAARIAANIDVNKLVGLLGATAFHGSPHRFERFDLSRVGTGEGNQAFGHGLYFSEHPDVARSYAAITPPAELRRLRDEMTMAANRRQRARERAAKATGEEREEFLRQHAQADAEYKALEAERDALVNDPGQLYEVEIPDEALDRMIDLEKSLAEDSPFVREAVGRVLDRLGYKPSDFEDYESGYSVVVRALQRQNDDLTDGQIQRLASELLRDEGIAGNRYLDAGSRGRAEGGTRNLVLFDDSLVTVTSRKPAE